MNLQSFQKLIKCAGNDDVVTIRADDASDLLALLFENKRKFYAVRHIVLGIRALIVSIHRPR